MTDWLKTENEKQVKHVGLSPALPLFVTRSVFSGVGGAGHLRCSPFPDKTKE